MVTHFTFDVDFGKFLQPTYLALGQTGTYAGATGSAPRSVTTYFVSYPSTPGTTAAAAGSTQYAVVEVGVCAGAQAYTPGDTQADWSVATNAGPGPSLAPLSGGTAPMVGATSPGLTVAPRTCGRGSIVFSVPTGSTVTSIEFTDLDGAALPFYRWTLP